MALVKIQKLARQNLCKHFWILLNGQVIDMLPVLFGSACQDEDSPAHTPLQTYTYNIW